MIRKPCCSRFSLHKFVHLKFFWTQFKNVHLRGPCSSRPCISRPYCTLLSAFVSFDNSVLKSELTMPPWVMMRRGRRWTSHKVKSTLPKSSLPYWPHRGRQGKTFSQELFFVQLCTDTVVIWQWGRVFLACLLVWRLDSAHQGSWSRANKSNSVVEWNIINLGTWKQPFRSASIKLYFAIFSRFLRLAN